MIELYAMLPLMYLAKRKHEIEDFKCDIFPQIAGALEDMGCTGSVNFTSSKDSPVGYDTAVIKANKPGAVPMDAIVTVKFPSAHPRNLYTIQWKDANGVTNQDTALVHKASDVPGVVEVYFKEAFGESNERREGKSPKKNRRTRNVADDPNVEDAKECKAVLDKLVVGSAKLKGYGLETVLTEDASIGAEMPFARVELGIRADKDAAPHIKAGDLLEYFTFDFSEGMCHITFHLEDEDWDEMLADHPSVTSMIEDFVPDIIDELENHYLVQRPEDKN